MIPIAAGVRIWIASGHTNMSKGMNGLALFGQGASAAIRSRAKLPCSPVARIR
jgi:hypothetical protein